MAAKLTRLAHKTAIPLHLVAVSCTICSSRSRRPVRKLLDTPFYSAADSVPTTEKDPWQGTKYFCWIWFPRMRLPETVA